MTRPTGRLAESLQLLATKLYAPKWREGMVARPALIERLTEGTRGTLTVISAPAGFGKTTLLAEWLASCDGPAGWVSLDESDNDASLFWAYVIAVIQDVRHEAGELALAMLHAREPIPIASILSTLINDITVSDAPFVLVLDDWHVIENDDVREGMIWFVEHVPAYVHVVLASRTVPDLPLARLRGRGQLTEIKASDLRFTQAEASLFVRHALGNEVKDDLVHVLENRTEGWVAGLKLAALSLRGINDQERFLASFTGDHPFIADFLVEEVLEHQPAHIRDFLLQTAILPRLCGDLCDAVTDQGNSREMLDELYRMHLFIVPLDDQRKWYRYHHLFADVLKSRLLVAKPALVPTLHRRASQWFQDRSQWADAVRHAMAVGDGTRMADLVEKTWRTMDRSFKAGTWLEWAQQVPRVEIRVRPVLSMGIGWALLDLGEIDEGAGHIQRAEAFLDGSNVDEPVIADQREWDAMPGTVAAARAFISQARGDQAATEEHASRALELLSVDDHFYRGIPLVILGLAAWTRGSLDEALEHFRAGADRFRDAGNPLFQRAAFYALASILQLKGCLAEALDMYAACLGHGGSKQAARAVCGMAEIALERGEWDQARRLLTESESAHKTAGEDEASGRWHAAQADLCAATGDLRGAEQRMQRAARVVEWERIPQYRPVAARLARIQIALEDTVAAEAWARTQRTATASTSEPSVKDAPDFLREYEYLTQVRLNVPELAREVLSRLAEGSACHGARIDALLQLSKLAFSAFETDEGHSFLRRAAELAELEGVKRPFVLEASWLSDPFRAFVRDGRGGAWARSVLEAMTDPRTAEPANPLSPREQEVLRLVASGLKNQQVADSLFISLATVKRHIANIYGKLEASGRMEAVALATENGLI